MEAELGAGPDAGVVAEFRQFAAEEPLRERRWELLARQWVGSAAALARAQDRQLLLSRAEKSRTAIEA